MAPRTPTGEAMSVFEKLPKGPNFDAFHGRRMVARLARGVTLQIHRDYREKASTVFNGLLGFGSVPRFENEPIHVLARLLDDVLPSTFGMGQGLAGRY